MAVSKKVDNIGWGPWSIKDKINHVQPPVSLLNQMITIRIHLDQTNEKNGCLKVVPKSQQLGILKQDAIDEYVNVSTPVFCQAQAGTALIMRPHILHSSNKASNSSQRRVLHLEYSSYTLPAGLEWA